MAFYNLNSVSGFSRPHQTTIRYPLRVLRYAVDAEANPWGLALDGFAAEGPQRLAASDAS